MFQKNDRRKFQKMENRFRRNVDERLALRSVNKDEVSKTKDQGYHKGEDDSLLRKNEKNYEKYQRDEGKMFWKEDTGNTYGNEVKLFRKKKLNKFKKEKNTRFKKSKSTRLQEENSRKLQGKKSERLQKKKIKKFRTKRGRWSQKKDFELPQSAKHKVLENFQKKKMLEKDQSRRKGRERSKRSEPSLEFYDTLSQQVHNLFTVFLFLKAKPLQ